MNTQSDQESVEILGRTTKIVMLAMAIVLVCMSVVSVLIVLNERSTQQNANDLAEQNEDLQIELRCLRVPAFNADRAEAELDMITARGLAAVGVGDQGTLEQLSRDLIEAADNLESAFDLREESLTRCREP